MKKQTIALVLVSALLGSVSHAVTIVMDRGTTTGMKVVNADGVSRVAIGQLIRWGTMTGPESAANFTEFTTTTISSVGTSGATATVPGSIRLDITIPGTAAAIANKQVYMWIYDSVAASNSVNQGLFTSTGWVVPSTFASDSSATYNLVLGQNTGSGTPLAPPVSSVNLAFLNTQASLTVGSVQNTPTGATNASGYVYQLGNAIPEPSAALLGAIGALGLLRRRRA
jgi:hypothetical protein